MTKEPLLGLTSMEYSAMAAQTEKKADTLWTQYYVGLTEEADFDQIAAAGKAPDVEADRGRGI